MTSAATIRSPGEPSTLLDAYPNFLGTARELYSSQVKWTAPARGIERLGREEVIRHLLREAGAMQEPDYTALRRCVTERQIIDEFAVRFVYTGQGIDNAPAGAGDFVELKRVRILELAAGKIAVETCIENWTVLLPHCGPRPWPQGT
jgi:hypothetical protein